jgi:polar amino acid transport system substrate-binding protein
VIRPRTLGSALAVVTILLGACSAAASDDDALDSLSRLPQPPSSTVPADRPEEPLSATQAACEAAAGKPETASFAPDVLPPPSEMPAGSAMQEILDEGRLRVGVDETTKGFSYRNATTGEIEGFEVDLAYEIAERIFGALDPAVILKAVPVDPNKKTQVVQDGTVDLTVSAVTMTCGRWEDVAFSTEYYTATQQFLVRKDSGIETAADLADGRVCVIANSTSSAILEEHLPEAELYPVTSRTECFAALQEGEVDAYFGHDSFLYGMVAQDPTVEVKTDLLRGVDTQSNYGIAISKDRPELVRFVNAVLEELRADGTWAALHEKWLEAPLGIPDAEPPEPSYRD